MSAILKSKSYLMGILIRRCWDAVSTIPADVDRADMVRARCKTRTKFRFYGEKIDGILKNQSICPDFMSIVCPTGENAEDFFRFYYRK